MTALAAHINQTAEITHNRTEPKRCTATKINVDVRQRLLATVSTFPDHRPAVTWAPARAENIPVIEKQPDQPLSVRQRELLNHLRDVVLAASAEIGKGCQMVGFQDISGFSDTDLRCVANACGGLLAKLNLRLDIDTAARMKAVRQSPLSRGEDRRAVAREAMAA